MLNQPADPLPWVVIPTYNERDNLAGMVEALAEAVPTARLLIVDDGSPDGTGDIADALAAASERVQVMHRTSKEGLGAAYRAGFARVLEDPTCSVVVQMDCDFSHDPADVPRLLAAISEGADLALGSRYVRGGSTPGWGLRRRAVSRLGGQYARLVLGVPYRDLTGGFKAWRPDLLRAVMPNLRFADGYGFQIETTFVAHRLGARIRELPIVFRDRTAGESKMSTDIVREALVAVMRMRMTAASRHRPQVGGPPFTGSDRSA